MRGVVNPGVEIKSEQTSQAVAMADEQQLHKLLTTLVLNAAEAGATSIEIQIRRRTLSEQDARFWAFTGDSLAADLYSVLLIKDNGEGLEPDDLSKVFDPFYSTKFLGRGLGLAAVLGILRGHHGGVAVTSESGAGSVFEFVFPIPGPA